MEVLKCVILISSNAKHSENIEFISTTFEVSKFLRLIVFNQIQASNIWLIFVIEDASN